MSENQESRAERIARYKEERRRQLAAQYSSKESGQVLDSPRKLNRDTNSSGSEGPRATRASRLRAAAAAAAVAASSQETVPKERSPVSSTVSSLASPIGFERDKSSKRKSNLNRSLTSEEVPPADIPDDAKTRRRRRRFFPPEVLQQSVHSSSNEDKFKSDTHTAYNTSPLSSPVTASTTRYSTKKSDLSIHMENARKSVTPACSDFSKNSRRTSATNLKERLPKHISSDVEYSYKNVESEINGNTIFSNKENIKRHADVTFFPKSSVRNRKVPTTHHSEDKSDKYRKSISISKRMDELTALTRETLVRVETLAGKNRPVHKKGLERKSPISKVYYNSEPSDSKDARSLVIVNESVKPHTSSILKKKTAEDCLIDQPSINVGSSVPVSILKRKVSQEENRSGSLSLTHTPPVTFSPSVIEPSSSSKKQGILKKRRSLDESQVLRHRSCSPDVANGKPDSRSILKNQRRSSLEEITRTHSPDSQLQGILKRKPFRSEDDPENPLNSPQSILKRRSGASSAGSTSGTQHVSIATAVILAAAGGAEIILDSNEHVRPILKKKSSEDHSYADNSHGEGLKPILKKKSSTDTDESEEKPKKPILKTPRSSLDNREGSEFDSTRYRHSISVVHDLNSECDVKPILKQTEEFPRGVKLSFCSTDSTYTDVVTRRTKSWKVDPEFSSLNVNDGNDFDREARRSRLSVSELVINFEEATTSTGAVPKKTGFKRSNDRYRTQPVTFNEIEASLNFVQSPQLDDFAKATGRPIESGNVQSLLNLSSSLENEALLNNLFSKTTATSSVSGVSKMSSDSAFQSLGDGLELEDDKSPTESEKPLAEKLETSKLQMKAIAEEAKKLRFSKNRDCDSPTTRLSLPEKIKKFSAVTTESTLLKRDVPKRRRSPFQTQPITSNEVETALSSSRFSKTQNDSVLAERCDSPTSTLSLAEKIKKFNAIISESNLLKCDLPKRTRMPFQTQPVTSNEVETTLSSSRFSKTQNDSEKDVDSSSKMSLSDKIKMFNASATETNLLKRDVPRRRRAQFQTQPITPAEVETARSTESFLRTMPSFTPDGVSGASARTERKGILKSKLGLSKSFKEVSPLQPRSVLKKVESNKSSEELYSPKSILKPETIDFTYDEGISSDDSASDTDIRKAKSVSVSEKENLLGKSASNKYNIGARLATINVDKLPELSVKSCSDSHTSDDSSGGREIQSIIGREAAAAVRARNKLLAEGLSKSKSHTKVGNEFQHQVAGVQRSMTQAAMPRTIGQLQAKLQQSGDTDWRKRIAKLNNSGEELNLLKAKNLYNEELSEKSSILAAKIDELDAATQKWKNRVEKNDAVNFSVAGRMQDEDKLTVSLNISSADKSRTPKAKRFRGKDGENNGKDSTRISPDPASNLGFKRSISVPGSGTTNDSSGTENSLRSSGRRVKILKPDDDNFKSFFRMTDEFKSEEKLDVSVEDFDVVTRETQELLVQKRTTKAQKRRAASKNPVKALASRSDIADEYEEILTGIADKEIKRLNVEKLAKSSSFALEALAGLASKEDFSSVLLKKCASPRSSLLPYKDLMLIHIKGRRHVQARLVEPVAASINEGDNYILITSNVLYNFIGSYSNIIEQTRACDIINYIQQTGDMGCKVEQVVTISSKKRTLPAEVEKFWNLLGSSSSKVQVTEAGHPDEDEVYETSILNTNIIYTIENNELVPVEEYWGKIPKIRMLTPSKVYVFDFGTEMYVWSGITASSDEKKTALKLAKDLWSEGYNYSDCSVNPINIATMLGAHKKLTGPLKSDIRPEWGLFAKVTQHTETILFREKFLDWPNYSRIIKSKAVTSSKSEPPITVSPCDAEEMRDQAYSEPDFEIDGTHLGRGHSYFDEETNRLFEISTLDVMCWHILENTFEVVPNSSVGHFYEADTYVIRWQYRVNISGRKLTGRPSSHNQTGRDRCLYFCWLGSKASINEKGTAALLTVELDKENARQIRVKQGLESTAFLRLFDGKMTIHIGKYDNDSDKADRLFMVKGEIDEEVALIEVPCSMRSLRSRSAFVLVQSETSNVIVWNGIRSTAETKGAAKKLAEHIAQAKSSHFGFSDEDDVTVIVTDEGQESSDFLEALGEKQHLYLSLLNEEPHDYKYTPRLFHFSSVSGSFKASEVLCSYRSQFVTPYPFLQCELYSANQPALFLFDNNHELWLWQGWWPEREDDSDLSDQVGSAVVRWQAERKAAMQTVIDYWRHTNTESKSILAYLVWAGLEPLEFTNLFPIWEDRDDIAELNIKEGRMTGEIVLVENEFAQLTRTTYPLSQLLQRPLPEGVDPTHLEIYLSPDEFTELLCMSKSDFQKLPAWKQTAIKKEKGLF